MGPYKTKEELKSGGPLHRKIAQKNAVRFSARFHTETGGAPCRGGNISNEGRNITAGQIVPLKHAAPLAKSGAEGPGNARW